MGQLTELFGFSILIKKYIEIVLFQKCWSEKNHHPVHFLYGSMYPVAMDYPVSSDFGLPCLL